MRPAKLLLAALPLVITGVAAAEPQDQAPQAPPADVTRNVSYSRSDNSVTRTVEATSSSGASAQGQRTWTHENNQTSVNASRTGPDGKTVEVQKTRSRQNSQVSRNLNASGPAGKSVARSSSRDTDISRQIHAIMGTGGGAAGAQASSKVSNLGISRTSLGAIPDTRVLAAQIAACQPAGGGGAVSAPSPDAIRAAAAQSQRIAQPDGVRHERPEALEQALRPNDQADQNDQLADSGPSQTRLKKLDFLPGQGTQPGSMMADKLRAAAANSKTAAGLAPGELNSKAARAARARASASASASKN